jgi:alpha-glucosidase
MANKINTTHFLPLGSVRAVERTARGVVLNVGEERFRVDVLEADVMRLKISQAKSFDEEPSFAVVSKLTGSVPFEVRQEDDVITVQTEKMRLVIRRDAFHLSAYRNDGTVIFEDAKDADGTPRGYLQLNDSFVITRRIGIHDSIYGLGEKTGAFDRRGRNFILWNTDVLQPGVLEQNRLMEADLSLNGASTKFDPYYASIPFFYHCRADGKRVNMGGFFIDNGYKGRFEFEHKDVYRYQFDGGQYTEYVFAGPDMPEILEAYTELTGRMSAPPLWSLGLHQCRFHNYTQDDILKLASEYRSREIPCDVLWLDIGYMNGYRVFTWDTQKFSDVPGMVSKLREDKLHLIAIVDPGVKLEPGNPVFEEGYAKNYFCKTESGKLYVGQVWPGRTVFPDFSREEVRTWWGALNARHASVGLSGIWNDMNEPATGDVAPFAMRFDRDGENYPHERFHNQYALLMAMGTHEGLKAQNPNLRTFILTRAAFAGIQRYAAQWLGDNQSDWGHLEMSVPMATGLGVSGQPFLGADVPGFMGRASAELAVRWTQYGALTPFLRYHNSIDETDHYPWSFGPGVESRSKAAIDLRYSLLPYIYSTFIQASLTGAPVMRPLVFHFQQDRQARETDDTYLFGSALLVAPISEPGRTARNVYLPEGTWIDFYTGEIHQGSRFITAQAPLDHVPVFARGGYVVPSHPVAPSSTMNHFPEALDLNVFVPAEDGTYTSELREDDGLTTGYETEQFWHTTFVVTKQGSKVSMRATVTGRGFREFRRSSFRLVFKGTKAPRVVLNGQERALDNGTLTFDNRAQGFELELKG